MTLEEQDQKKMLKIEKGNAIIAEFMGYEYIPEDKDQFAWANYGWWLKGVYHPLIDAFNNKSWLGFTHTLKYHNDWNWLMKVIQKIGEIPHLFNPDDILFNRLVDIVLTPAIKHVNISDVRSDWYNQMVDLNEPCVPWIVEHNDNFIEAVWLASIQFIEWYNKYNEDIKNNK